MEDAYLQFLEDGKMDYKKYQYDGVKWMVDNETKIGNEYHGGIIADEMGLGKTIIVLGACVLNKCVRTLIIVPPILISQWRNQILRATGVVPLVWHGEFKKRITYEELYNAQFVLTSYGAITLTKKQLLNKEETLLHKVEWNRVVFDEAHHLRNMKTSRFRSAKQLISPIRWLVTGTPIQNKKSDFYALCSLANISASIYANTETLLQHARNFILKRTKRSVGIDMVSVVASTNIVSWRNINEKKLFDTVHNDLYISRVVNENGEVLNRCINIKNPQDTLSTILRARQACIYPKLLMGHFINEKKNDNNQINLTNENIDASAFQGSSKIDSVVSSVLSQKDNGCGKLIFCHFRAEMDEIHRRLTANGMRVALIDGRISAKKRSKILDDNMEGLILQIQTGCEGLNLQDGYSEVYFVSPHWNPAVQEQAIARCHRLGQTKTVFVREFEMEGSSRCAITVEKYMEFVKEFKRSIACKL